MNIVEYIKSLNLNHISTPSEDMYYISDIYYYITIEYNTNVFFVDLTSTIYKYKYTNIKTIEHLKKIFKEKIGIDLSLYERKTKLKKLNNYSE